MELFHHLKVKTFCAGFLTFYIWINLYEIVNEYDQEIPQSQTADNPWHREEEPLNHHETPGRQTKQSNQPPPPHQDDRNTRMDTKQRTTKHRTTTDSHKGSNNKQKVNNNRTTALERTAAQATRGLKCIPPAPNPRPRLRRR